MSITAQVHMSLDASATGKMGNQSSELGMPRMEWRKPHTAALSCHKTFLIRTKGKKLFLLLQKKKKRNIIKIFSAFEKVENAIFTFCPDTAPAFLMDVVYHD
ncbi:hypothetical protein EK904_014735 [Melospiza melodia maxima]|nr:hypothetical protein EK904_014735 [Melospiza melodia maxima]